MTDETKPASGLDRRIGPWAVHETETAFENPWIRIESSRVTHPGGAPGTYGVVRFANLAIGVLPIDEEGFTWLVGQHRFPLDAYSWELPEGGGARDIAPISSAKRELSEETGFTAGQWLEIGRWHLSNSVTDEQAIGFLAWTLKAGIAAPEDSEELELRRVPAHALLDMCLSGEITDSLTNLMVLSAAEKARRGDLPEKIASALLGG